MRKNRTPAKNYLLTDGLHPALVDEITFRQAAKRMSENRKSTVKSTILKNPLSGLIYLANAAIL